jgi:hypothetical protein
MRLLIAGETATAKALRGQLARKDCHLTAYYPHLTIRIEEQPGAVRPLLDSVDGELERAILRHRKQTVTPIEIQTAGGVQSDREIRIVLPPTDEERRAVEEGVFRALLELSNRIASRGGKLSLQGKQNEQGFNVLLYAGLSDYYLDVSVSGEGALVTYFQT